MDHKNFLFVSLSGLIGDIAWQVLKEGHDVRYFIEAERRAGHRRWVRAQVDGLGGGCRLGRCDRLRRHPRSGRQGAGASGRGKMVVGGTAYTDRLEDDRSFGQEELRAAGVGILPYKEFDNFD